MISKKKLVAVCFAALLLPTTFSLMNAASTFHHTRSEIDSLRQTGVRFYTEGKYAEAVQTLSLIESDSTTPAIQFYLGMSYASLNDLEHAMPSLKSAAFADTLNMGYRFQFARILAEAGETRQAQHEYEFIIGKDSSYIPAYWQLGVLFYEQKMYERASGVFLHLITVNPRDFLSYYYLGSSFVGLKNIDSARMYLATCLTINRDFVPAITALASLYYDARDYREALRLYTIALTRFPENAELNYKIGLCHNRLEQYPDAIAPLQQAIRIDSLKDLYHAQLGYAYLFEKKFDSAEVEYRKAVKLDEDNPLYYVNLALALSRLNRIDDAADSYQRALASYHPENIADVYIRLGTLYYLQKHYHDALDAYRQAVEYQPKNREAQFYLALAYDQMKDSPSAIKQYKKYLKLASDDTTSRERERKHEARQRLQNLRGK